VATDTLRRLEYGNPSSGNIFTIAVIGVCWDGWVHISDRWGQHGWFFSGVKGEDDPGPFNIKLTDKIESGHS